MPRESAWEILNELGDTSKLHFIDPTPGLPLINRPFANYIKRCDETLLRINFIEGEMNKFGKEILPCPNYDD